MPASFARVFAGLQDAYARMVCLLESNLFVRHKWLQNERGHRPSDTAAHSDLHN